MPDIKTAIVQCSECGEDLDEAQHMIHYRSGNPYCEYCADEIDRTNGAADRLTHWSQ